MPQNKTSRWKTMRPPEYGGPVRHSNAGLSSLCDGQLVVLAAIVVPIGPIGEGELQVACSGRSHNHRHKPSFVPCCLLARQARWLQQQGLHISGPTVEAEVHLRLPPTWLRQLRRVCIELERTSRTHGAGPRPKRSPRRFFGCRGRPEEPAQSPGEAPPPIALVVRGARLHVPIQALGADPLRRQQRRALLTGLGQEGVAFRAGRPRGRPCGRVLTATHREVDALGPRFARVPSHILHRPAVARPEGGRLNHHASKSFGVEHGHVQGGNASKRGASECSLFRLRREVEALLSPRQQTPQQQLAIDLDVPSAGGGHVLTHTAPVARRNRQVVERSVHTCVVDRNDRHAGDAAGLDEVHDRASSAPRDASECHLVAKDVLAVLHPEARQRPRAEVMPRRHPSTDHALALPSQGEELPTTMILDGNLLKVDRHAPQGFRDCGQCAVRAPAGGADEGRTPAARGERRS
mmetsp:Transcript_62091/g.157889  ORF Transcript_62091/g.157889 Transcript_62091/m.157889 type:complete len:464 (+) Transcript_62091:60-1451(+)